MKINYSVSLVFVTYNRSDIIVDTVNSYKNQSYRNFEILVVDQTKNVPKDVINFFTTQTSQDIRYIHLESPGLTKARNIGLESSKGEIVIFVDDDTEPLHENFISSHVRNYYKENIIGVSGRIVDHRYSICSNPNKILKISRWGEIMGGKNGVIRTNIDVLSGGNMSFRRDLALRNDCWFDPKISGTAQGEDIHFSLKLLKKTGGKFIFDPEASIKHFALEYGGDSSRAVPSIYRHFWRIHNYTYIWLEYKDKVILPLYILYRIVGNILISIRERSIRSLWWLNYAIFLSLRTHQGKSWSKKIIQNIKKG